MRKKITPEFIARAKKCVFGMKNAVNFYQTTGMHFTTLQRVLERGWADEEQIKLVTEYCDEVEGLSVSNSRD